MIGEKAQRNRQTWPRIYGTKAIGNLQLGIILMENKTVLRISSS